MPAIPALIIAGSSIAGSAIAAHSAKSAAAEAAKRSPEEQALMGEQTQLARQLRGQGQQIFASAMPGIRSTLDYYQSLLSGDRQARMNAVSGEAQDVGQAYTGSANAIKRTLRGGERDEALAQNETGRAGAVARLVTGVRPGAASAIGGLSGPLVGAATNAMSSGGNVGANLLGNYLQNRQGANAYGYQAGASAGQGFGQLFGQLLSLIGTKGGGTGFSAAGPYASGYKFPKDSTPDSLLDR